MPVTMTMDGDRVADVRKSKVRTKGSDRPGYQASNLLAAMTVLSEKGQMPRVERPRIVVETMRVVGPDNLTARDQAIYEFLLSVARLNGIEKETHQVDMADIMRFLSQDSDRIEVRHMDRVVESLDRIARTCVRYAFLEEEGAVRRRATMSLISFETKEMLRAGTATVSYSIPAKLRQVMLDAEDYVMLEINAFPQFKCRYSARLYQRLALRARYAASVRKPWVVEPQALAVELGFPAAADGNWHHGVFMRDAIKPALEDMGRHVHRFDVQMQEIRGPGRGRPVAQLVFHVIDRKIAHPKEAKASKLGKVEMNAIVNSDRTHAGHELPSIGAVSRAATMTGLTADQLSKGYRAALDRAKADPNVTFGEGLSSLQGGMLLYFIKDGDTDGAFFQWAQTIEKGVVPSQRRAHDPAPQVFAPRHGPQVLIDRPTYKVTLYPALAKSSPPPPAPTVARPAPAKAAPLVNMGDCPF